MARQAEYARLKGLITAEEAKSIYESQMAYVSTFDFYLNCFGVVKRKEFPAI